MQADKTGMVTVQRLKDILNVSATSSAGWVEVRLGGEEVQTEVQHEQGGISLCSGSWPPQRGS